MIRKLVILGLLSAQISGKWCCCCGEDQPIRQPEPEVSPVPEPVIVEEDGPVIAQKDYSAPLPKSPPLSPNPVPPLPRVPDLSSIHKAKPPAPNQIPAPEFIIKFEDPKLKKPLADTSGHNKFFGITGRPYKLYTVYRKPDGSTYADANPILITGRNEISEIEEAIRKATAPQQPPAQPQPVVQPEPVIDPEPEEGGKFPLDDLIPILRHYLAREIDTQITSENLIDLINKPTNIDLESFIRYPMEVPITLLLSDRDTQFLILRIDEDGNNSSIIDPETDQPINKANIPDLTQTGFAAFRDFIEKNKGKELNDILADQMRKKARDLSLTHLCI